MPPVERLMCEPAEWCEATWGSQGSEIDRAEQLECAMVGDGLKQSWNEDQNRHGGAEGHSRSLFPTSVKYVWHSHEGAIGPGSCSVPLPEGWHNSGPGHSRLRPGSARAH